MEILQIRVEIFLKTCCQYAKDYIFSEGDRIPVKELLQYLISSKNFEQIDEVSVYSHNTGSYLQINDVLSKNEGKAQKLIVSIQPKYLSSYQTQVDTTMMMEIEDYDNLLQKVDQLSITTEQDKQIVDDYKTYQVQIEILPENLTYTVELEQSVLLKEIYGFILEQSIKNTDTSFWTTHSKNAVFNNEELTIQSIIQQSGDKITIQTNKALNLVQSQKNEQQYPKYIILHFLITDRNTEFEFNPSVRDDNSMQQIIEQLRQQFGLSEQIYKIDINLNNCSTNFGGLGLKCTPKQLQINGRDKIFVRVTRI